MLRKLLFAPLLILISSLSFADTGSQIEIKDPWVRSAPPTASVMAGYLQLINHSHDTISLESVSSPQFHSVEIHRTVNREGVMHMEKMEPLDLAGHQEIIFEPGGFHLMLMNPHEPLHEGDVVHLVFKFSNGDEIMVDAKVQDRGPGGEMMMMDHDKHQHH